MKVSLIFLSLMLSLKASTRELVLAAKPRVKDLYKQGFYPSGHMGSGIKVYLYSTRVRFEGTNSSLYFERGELTMTCSPDGKLLHGTISYEESPYPPEALERLNQMAVDLGVELMTSRKKGVIGRPEKEPGMPDWDHAGASVQFSDRDLKVSLNGKAVLGQIQIFVHFSQEYRKGQGLRRFNEWGGTYPIQLPPKWQYLPIPGPHRGYDPEVQKFTYLVSSYDNEGNLLPKFQKLRAEIESKASGQNQLSRSKERGEGPVKPFPDARSQRESVPIWLVVTLGLVLLAAGYWQLRKPR